MMTKVEKIKQTVNEASQIVKARIQHAVEQASETKQLIIEELPTDVSFTGCFPGNIKFQIDIPKEDMLELYRSLVSRKPIELQACCIYRYKDEARDKYLMFWDEWLCNPKFPKTKQMVEVNFLERYYTAGDPEGTDAKLTVRYADLQKVLKPMVLKLLK